MGIVSKNMHSTHSPAPKRQVPPENKKFKEIVVTKTQGTVYDPLWYFLFIFVAFFIVWLRTEIVKIRDAYWKVPGVSEVEMKSFNDLWWALAACIGIAAARHIFLWLTTDWYTNRLISFNTPEATLDSIVDKNRDYGFGIIMYSLLCGFSYYTYWGSPSIPVYIGGTGNVSLWWSEPPFLTAPLPYIDGFYLIQMGYHLHNLLHQLIWRNKRATYVEMLLHHVIAET